MVAHGLDPAAMAQLPLRTQLLALLVLSGPLLLMAWMGSAIAYERAEELAAKFDKEQVPVGKDALKLFLFGLCSWPAYLFIRLKKKAIAWTLDGNGLIGKLY